VTEQKFDELTDRATVAALQRAEMVDAFKQMQARAHVEDVIAEMKEEGKALILSDEEMRMLESFRRFKGTCKNGEVFKWQTRRTEPEALVVPAPAQVHITDPQDVSGR